MTASRAAGWSALAASPSRARPRTPESGSARAWLRSPATAALSGASAWGGDAPTAGAGADSRTAVRWPGPYTRTSAAPLGEDRSTKSLSRSSRSSAASTGTRSSTMVTGSWRAAAASTVSSRTWRPVRSAISSRIDCSEASRACSERRPPMKVMRLDADSSAEDGAPATVSDASASAAATARIIGSVPTARHRGPPAGGASRSACGRCCSGAS